jgi:hypothetical protein
MPSLPVILAFMAATLALNFTPGADMAYVQAQNRCALILHESFVPN